MNEHNSGAEINHPQELQTLSEGSDSLPAIIRSGTIVLTLKGALAVEQLRRGDRVVTRSGTSSLKRIRTHGEEYFALEFDSTQVVYILASQDGDEVSYVLDG